MRIKTKGYLALAAGGILVLLTAIACGGELSGKLQGILLGLGSMGDGCRVCPFFLRAL